MVWFLVRTVLDTHNTPPAPAAHEADRRHPTSDMATNQCKCTATAESFYGLNRDNYTYSHTLKVISRVECFQFFEALRYMSQGRGFNSWWSHCNFSLTMFPAALWPCGRLSFWQKWVPGIFPGGKVCRCLWLTTLPPSCVDCLEIWEPQTPRTFKTSRDL